MTGVQTCALPICIVASSLPWLQVREGAFSREDMATARLRLMRVSSAGAFARKEGAATTFAPLISTTGESALIEARDVLGRPNPNEFLEKFKPGGKPFVIAARVSGSVNSAYPDGEPQPPPEPGSDKPQEPPKAGPDHLAKSKAPIHAVVVGDVDILSDDHVVNDNGQLISSNADFVLNLIDTLAGGADLATLRGRGMSLRTFTRVENMERDAEALYQSREHSLNADLEKSQGELQQMLARGASQQGEALALTREQQDRKSTRLNSSHIPLSRMPSSA